MNRSEKETEGRVFGGVAGAAVTAWVSPTEEEVDQLPPLPQISASPPASDSTGPPPGKPEPPLPAGIAEDGTHAYLFRHAQETAKVVRTMARTGKSGVDDGPLAGCGVEEMVAAILTALGTEVGAAVVGHLGSDEMEFAARSLSDSDEVTHAVGIQALEIVRQRVVDGDYLEPGGLGYARDVLSRARGPNVSRILISRAQRPGTSGFDRIRDMRPEDMAPFIWNEHPQTIALILSQLNPPQAAGVLARFPDRLRADVAYRMATMVPVVANVLRQVEEDIEEKFEDTFGGDVEVGGPEAVAELLDRSAADVRAAILQQIEERDEAVAGAVRDAVGGRGSTEAAEQEEGNGDG